MSITDELRKFAWKECPSKFLERVTGIADRIDAAHEKMPDHWALEFLQLTDAAIDLRDRLEKAEDENAKLRELARDLYECVSHANEQDWFYFERNMLGCGMCCTVNGESCGLSVLTARMHELGVDI